MGAGLLVERRQGHASLLKLHLILSKLPRSDIEGSLGALVRRIRCTRTQLHALAAFLHLPRLRSTRESSRNCQTLIASSSCIILRLDSAYFGLALEVHLARGQRIILLSQIIRHALAAAHFLGGLHVSAHGDTAVIGGRHVLIFGWNAKHGDLTMLVIIV